MSNMELYTPEVEEKKDTSGVDQALDEVTKNEAEIKNPDAFEVRRKAAEITIKGIKDYFEQLNSPEIAQQAKEMLESESFKEEFQKDSDAATAELLGIMAQPEYEKMKAEAEAEIKQKLSEMEQMKEAA